MIDWKTLKETPADGVVRTATAAGGLEYRHNPQTKMRVESIEIHDGNEAIRIIRQGAGWSKPHRVNWR
jgi:hypothetical protein